MLLTQLSKVKQEVNSLRPWKEGSKGVCPLVCSSMLDFVTRGQAPLLSSLNFIYNFRNLNYLLMLHWHIPYAKIRQFI